MSGGVLKPCPFCGSPAWIRNYHQGSGDVHCSNVFCCLWPLRGVTPAMWRVRVPVCTDPQTALGFLQGLIMAALADVPELGMYRSLSGLSSATGLPREVIRGVLEDLRANGLVQWRLDLLTEDGEVAGSGYALTARGRADARAT